MRMLMSGVALAALVALATPMDGEAQRGPRGQQMGPRADRGGGVEMVLRLRERLELDEEQVARLDAIRAEVVERRTAHQSQMAELRSQVRAGTMARSQLLEIARARREGAQAVRDETRARVEEILTEKQRQELEVVRARWEGFVRGRAGARRDDGPAARGFHDGRPGFRPWHGPRGGRGPGF